MNIEMDLLKKNIENEINNTQYAKAIKSQSVVEYLGSHIESIFNLKLKDISVKIDPFSKSIHSAIELDDGFKLEAGLKFSDEVFTKLEAKFKF